MTETTEGLTRRISSGSDSPRANAGGAAAKKKRAGSASHRGSLRFNISGAFFSKGVAEPEAVSAPAGGFNGRNPKTQAARRGRATTFGHYAGILRDVNLFVTKLCRAREKP